MQTVSVMMTPSSRNYGCRQSPAACKGTLQGTLQGTVWQAEGKMHGVPGVREYCTVPHYLYAVDLPRST